jgi:hypothetical protein
VLRRYGLADASAYQVGFAPDNTLGGWFEIIRGEYALDPDQTLTFLRDVFGEAYGLKDYTIQVEVN